MKPDDSLGWMTSAVVFAVLIAGGSLVVIGLLRCVL